MWTRELAALLVPALPLLWLAAPASSAQKPTTPIQLQISGTLPAAVVLGPSVTIAPGRLSSAAGTSVETPSPTVDPLDGLDGRSQSSLLDRPAGDPPTAEVVPSVEEREARLETTEVNAPGLSQPAGDDAPGRLSSDVVAAVETPSTTASPLDGLDGRSQSSLLDRPAGDPPTAEVIPSVEEREARLETTEVNAPDLDRPAGGQTVTGQLGLRFDAGPERTMLFTLPADELLAQPGTEFQLACQGGEFIVATQPEPLTCAYAIPADVADVIPSALTWTITQAVSGRLSSDVVAAVETPSLGVGPLDGLDGRSQSSLLDRPAGDNVPGRLSSDVVAAVETPRLTGEAQMFVGSDQAALPETPSPTASPLDGLDGRSQSSLLAQPAADSISCLQLAETGSIIVAEQNWLTLPDVTSAEPILSASCVAEIGGDPAFQNFTLEVNAVAEFSYQLAIVLNIVEEEEELTALPVEALLSWELPMVQMPEAGQPPAREPYFIQVASIGALLTTGVNAFFYRRLRGN